MDPIAEAWANLLVAILIRAVEDARGGEAVCDGKCAGSKGGHCCRQDAVAFLSSPGGQSLLESLGVADVAAVLRSLPEPGPPLQPELPGM